MSSVKTPLTYETPFSLQPDFLAASVNVLTQQCHGAAVAGSWWHKLPYLNGQCVYGKSDSNGVPYPALAFPREIPELLCLIHSEIFEAMEGDRKGLMDDKLPQYKMIDVELADAMIRICDLAGARAVPLGEILAAKMQFNAQRADHKPENRNLPGGKKY